MQFAEALSLHLDYLKFLNLRPRTIENYRSSLQAFGAFCKDAGVTDITAITPKILERYRSHLFETHNGVALSIGAQVQKLCALNRFYQTLVQKGLLMVNIAQKAGML